MHASQRLDHIVKLVGEKGFVSVAELSASFAVTPATIRRDLRLLDQEKRLQRTHGGALALRLPYPPESEDSQAAPSEDGLLANRIDVLIATQVDPYFNRSILDQMARAGIPVISESQEISGVQSVIAVDCYQAGFRLGQWAGRHALTHFDGRAHVLDLTFHLRSTQDRSQGFLEGVRDVLPGAEPVLSIDAQSRQQTAYQITADALAAHPHINMIFAVNDSTAVGALQACHDLGVPVDSLLLVTFGLEGDTFKDALMAGSYCKVGLAMFPEIVGRVCVETAIAAFNDQPLPRHLVTPHAVLTPQTLGQFYSRQPDGWHCKWEAALSKLDIPLAIDRYRPRASGELPARLGFIVPFMEHEWYRNLIVCLQEYGRSLGIDVEVIDADKILRDDIVSRQRAIARLAAEQVQPGNVILLDTGQVTTYLAEELVHKDNITVITNSAAVLGILRDRPGITLISTGGMLRPSSETLIGPIAEASLRELRADKLFLAVTGITLKFGLSHTHMAEVAMKQAMIGIAREVILLADHTVFGRELGMQIGPATLVKKLVTDNALPPDHRLELGKLGIQVIIAKT